MLKCIFLSRVSYVTSKGLNNCNGLWCLLELVERKFPWGGDLDNMKDCINYLSQAQNSVTLAQELQITSSTITDLLDSMAGYFQVTGQHSEAIVYYKRALKIKEKEFGVDHINTADTINNLGITYDSQGKYDEAIAQYERALRIYEKAFGVDHINTADTINNLGITYRQSGQVRRGDRTI